MAVNPRPNWRRMSDEGRMDALVDLLEPRIRRAFRLAIETMKLRLPMRQLADLLAVGRIEEALDVVLQSASILGDAKADAIAAAARDAAAFINSATDVHVAFDVVNERAVNVMRTAKLDLIREFTADQRAATRQALTDGVRRGLNPRDQALAFRDSLGLTSRQQQAVDNYRRMLQEGNREALERQLRDRRFDASVRRAIDGEGLTPEQIERMVGRYRERYINYRATTIARTEALSAANQGNDEMWQQAVDSGNLQPEQLLRSWSVRQDGSERDWHRAMAGQRRKHGEPFRSGRGNLIRYPGDPAAPGVERINCRCSVVTRIRPPGEQDE